MSCLSRPRPTLSGRCASASPLTCSISHPTASAHMAVWSPACRSRNWPMPPGRSTRWWPQCCVICAPPGSSPPRRTAPPRGPDSSLARPCRSTRPRPSGSLESEVRCDDRNHGPSCPRRPGGQRCAAARGYEQQRPTDRGRAGRARHVGPAGRAPPWSAGGLRRTLAAVRGKSDVRTVDAGDALSLAAAIAGVGVVLSVIGPFTRLASPVIDACLAVGVPYVDIATSGLRCAGCSTATSKRARSRW
jgi:hypothetical protein